MSARARLSRTTALSAIALTIAGCAKETPSTTTTTTADDTAEAAPLTAAEGLTAITSAMSSAMSDGDSLAEAAVRVGKPAGANFTTDVDTVCKDSGYAYTGSDDGAPVGAPAQNTAEYAARNAYCGLVKSPDGPDTARGALDRVKAFVCAVGDVTYDDVERDVTVTIDTTCFSQTFVDMAAEQGITSATLPVTGYSDPAAMDVPGSASYDKGLKIDLTSVMGGPSFYYIQFTSTGTTFEASMLSTDGETADWFMNGSLDTTDETASELKLEGRFFGNNDDADSRRFMRAHVQGETTDGEFTAPSLVEYILFDVSSTDGTPSSVDYNTLKGNATDGYYAWYGQASGDGLEYLQIVPTIVDNVCVGDGDCTGNDGLVVDTEAKLDYLKSAFSDNTNDFVDPTAAFTAAAPLTFTELSFDTALE